MRDHDDSERVIPAPPAPPDPQLEGSERRMLVEFLDYHRAVLLRKAAGLTSGQLAARVGASTLTLGGLLKHMAYVEDHWFHSGWAANPPVAPWATVDWNATPDWELDSASSDAPEELEALFTAAVERSRASIADSFDLDATTSIRGRAFSLRWILIHMVEEYARHCGHADLLREAIDGATGD
jgi:uncharacterized damage-inducible protein DinB